jgi:D-alanine-D-alanine ligase
VFNLFEGFPGDPASEVQVALLLRSLGLRPTGCPPLSLHLGLHKDEAKRILREAGLLVVGGGLCRSCADAGAFLPSAFPLFLKPAASDASHGIDAGNLVRDAGALQERLREMLDRFPGGVLVEPFLPGREFNCSAVEVSGDWVALPPSLVDYSGLDPELPPVLTFEAKWATESEVFVKTPTVCPAPVEARVAEAVRSATRRAVAALRCRGYARADFREDSEGRLHLLEVNPNPGLAADAGMAKQARAMGWTYDALVLAILEAAEGGDPWTC